jgi:O-glycosyl hydrolase
MQARLWIACFRVSSILFLLFLTSSRITAEVKVVVDNTRPHQVMEGFGATNISLVLEGLGDTLTPSLRARLIEAVYKQVGISMGSLSIGPYETTGGYLQSANDDGDPFHFNWAGFNWRASDAIKQKLVDLAQPYGFDNYYLGGPINTRWELPWLEQIRRQDYNRYLDEAAEHVAAAAIHWRDAYGIVPRYYMLFNEPLGGNNELMNGTVQDVVDIVKRAGARLRSEGFRAIKFVVPSEVSEEKSLTVTAAVLSDPEARQYVGAIGYHPYPYGSVYASIPNILRTSGRGKPDPDRITIRNRIRDLGRQYGIPVWMNEVSNGGVDPVSFDSLRGRAIHIHDELVYGDAAAYFGMDNIWDTVVQRGHFGNNNLFATEGGIALADNDRDTVYITGMGYAIGHYARWVKRGAVRIEATSSDPLLQVTAFRDDVRKVLVLVLINNAPAGSMVNVTLAGFEGAPVGTFTGEQSTPAASWLPLSPFRSNTPTRLSVSLPGYSVTTLSAGLAAPAS